MVKRELHQHDLKPERAQSFVATAGISAGDCVLEVGPGLGNITAALLAAKARVYAVEVDAERCVHLRQRFAADIEAGYLHLTTGDALDYMPLIEGPWRVVANPPFKLSAALLHQWLFDETLSNRPTRIDVVVQYQTAQKWCGEDRRYSQTAILCHLLGDPTIHKKFKRTDVEPASHVDLCGWCLKLREDAPSIAVMGKVEHVLEQAFAGAHTVRDSLRGIATPKMLKRQAKMYDWNIDAHPRTVSPQAWLSLTEFLMSLGRL